MTEAQTTSVMIAPEPVGNFDLGAHQLQHEEPEVSDSESEEVRNVKWTNREVRSLVKEYIAYRSEHDGRHFFTEDDCRELERRVDTERPWGKVRNKMVELLKRFSEYVIGEKTDPAVSKFHRKLFLDLEAAGEDPSSPSLFVMGGGSRGTKRKRGGNRTAQMMERVGVQEELIQLVRRNNRQMQEFQKHAIKRHEELVRQIAQLRDLMTNPAQV